MNVWTAALSVLVLGTTVSYARVSDACTQPSEEAGDPTVEPGDPGNTPPGDGTGSEDPSGSGGDPGGADGSGDPAGADGSGDPAGADGSGDPAGADGSGDPSGTPLPGADPAAGGSTTFEPDPASGSGDTGSTPSALIALNWAPGYDLDADPSRGYFRHAGHRIETRIVIRDRTTGAVVLDERVPQYNYETATRSDPGPTLTRFKTRLPPGDYLAKVQSVFYRHDEIRFGLSGSWKPLEEALPAPEIDDSVRGVAFSVSALRSSSGFISGGCSVTGRGELAPSLALLAFLALGLVRRRAA